MLLDLRNHQSINRGSKTSFVYKNKELDIEIEYKKILKRVGKSKGNLHTDAPANLSLSPETLKSNFSHVNVFRKWIIQNYPKIKSMHEITPEIADHYMENLRETRKSKTYNNHLNSLCVIWKRLKIKAGISSNPFESIMLISNSVQLMLLYDHAERPALFLKMQLDQTAQNEWPDNPSF